MMSHKKNPEIRKRIKDSNSRNRPHGIVVEASDVSDFESSGSNTMSSTTSQLLFPPSGIRKSHSSVEGIKSISTQKEALATLDGFLNEVEKAVEEAKEDEKQKLASKPKSNSRDYTREQQPLVMRRSNSFPNILKEVNGMRSDDKKNIPKSTSELDKDDNGEQFSRFQPKEKKNSSKGIENSDLQHLTSLYKLVERLENLQTKKESLPVKKVQEKTEDVVDAPAQANPKPSKSHKKVSNVHKEHKKGHKLKIKSSGSHQSKYSLGKPKYHEIISRKFMAKTKSLENIKAALHSEKHEQKSQAPKQNYLQPYASDDLIIEKPNTEIKWQSASTKASEKSSKPNSLSRADATNDLSQGFVPKDEPEIIPEKIVEENEPPCPGCGHVDAPEINNTQSPIKLENYFDNSETTYEDTTSVNHSMSKSTEWMMLQKAFPLPQPTTSEDLWAEFNVHRNNKSKKGSTPHKRRRSWFLSKADKKRTPSMFLPNADLAGFNVNLMAAQSLSDQLTLSLDITTLENTLAAHSDNGSLLSPSDFSFNESLQVI